MLKILIILNILINFLLECSASQFWLSVDIMAIEWKEGCLNALGCTESWFKISEWDLINTERVSASWPVNRNHNLVSYRINF